MKKLMILLVLTRSLQLNCAFNAIKKVGETVCAIPLTTLAVNYAYKKSNEKESIAKHEAGHTIIAFQGNENIIEVSIEHDLMNCYSGACKSQIKYPYKNNYKHLIAGSLGGLAQDLQDQHWLQRQNFMELELDLPLTRSQRQLTYDLEYMIENHCYRADLKNAYKCAYLIAEREQLNKDYQNSDYYFYSSFVRDYKPSLDAVKQIEDRVKLLLLQGLQDAKNIVAAHQPEIDAIAQELYDKEYLSGDEVKAIIENCKK